MLVESYSRTRWLDKLRPAGAPHRWMGRGARWHLSWPLADTTAQKENDYISRFVHVILAPVHAILLCIIQARNSSNYVRHPYAATLLSSARADVEIFLRGHCRRRSKKNWQELRPMYRRDSSPEYSTRIPYVSPMPSYINKFLNPAIHSSKLHTQKKTTCHLRGHAAQKKTRYVLFLYMPKRRPKSRSCHRKPLCTRAVLISVSFKSDEHQYSSSRASATDEPNATLRRVSSLQMTPIHSHSSRSSSSRHIRKEVGAWIWPRLSRHKRCQDKKKPNLWLSAFICKKKNSAFPPQQTR